MTGVGVKPSPLCMYTSARFAASTSSATRSAGRESAWVSLPIKIGPVIPWVRRYSQIACVMARMCDSVNVAFKLVPRWPLVPKLTS